MGKTGVTVAAAMVLMLLCQDPAGAEVFCVDPAGGGTHTSLQAALAAAATNGADDTIQVVRGTYDGNFAYSSSEGRSLVVEGGYASGCACRTVDPAHTILDGGGSGGVLSVNDTGGADLTIDGFTVQNGAGVFYGGGIYAQSRFESGAAGNVTIRNNIVTANAADNTGGGIYAVSTAYGDAGNGQSGDVTLVNNIVTGNRAVSLYGGGLWADIYSHNDSAGTVTLTNNTVHGNISGDPLGGGVGLYLWGAVSGGDIFVTNNIVRGNLSGASTNDIYILKGPGSAWGFHNDFQVKGGDAWDDSGSNIDADPAFRTAGYWADANTWVDGDYHLRPGSPCVDTGSDSAQGLGVFDFEGDPRQIDGDADGTATVDMGADEHRPGAMPGMPLLLLD